MNSTTSSLKKIFLQISNGYSFSSELNLYVKHLTLVDEVACFEARDAAAQRGKDYGLQSEDDLLQQAIKNSKWSEDKERALKTFEKDYKQLHSARFTPISEDQLSSLREELKEIEKEWLRVLNEKQELFINSIEQFSSKIAYDTQLSISLFRDAELKIPAFSSDDFEYLNDIEFIKIRREYSTILEQFSFDNLNLIAVEPFFQRRLSLGSLYDFWGKPSYSLTENQVNLLKIGEKFKTLLEETGDLPEDYQTPEGIEDWFYLKRAGVLKSNADIVKQKQMWD